MNLLLIAGLVILLVLTACHKSSDSGRVGAPASETTQAAPPPDGVRRISIPELRAALERGEAVLVDVRGGVDYELGHIKDAVSLPLGLIAERGKELPREKLIVAYCACTHEQLSIRAVEELKKVGIENAVALTGGLDEWKREGLPTEGK